MERLDSLVLEKAMTLALEQAPKKKESEIVTLDRALGRVLAKDLAAVKNLPAFDNSAMDGFAFRHEDAGKRLKIISTIFAGDRPKPRLKRGEGYRIMTGAPVPSDADTVVPIEKCSEVTEETVTLPDGVKAGENLRRRGEELRIGAPLLKAGTRLDAPEIALLSAQGIMAVSVYAPLRIAVLSTGNELREPWETADEEQIYNANAFGILALLESYGFAAEYHGRIPDDRGATEAMIAGLKGYDVILTSGGISMGEADHLYRAFLFHGLKPLFHGINVKPGRPTMMGVMGGCFVMAMPGNPLATMLNVEMLSIPVLRSMQGMKAIGHRRALARMGEDLKLRGGRSEIVLGHLHDGRFFPTRGNRYGSGMLTPLAESDAVVIFDEASRGASEGEIVEVKLLGDPGSL
ncbi:molybdopterin molybdotransferase MoeA [Nitratifractor sp.]